MSQNCCKECRRVREHVASLLPFKVLEAVVGKPLRISGVAMAAGMSRNFNVYTPEELQAFAPLLVGAPVYIEHVAVDSAAGKVTKCTYDALLGVCFMRLKFTTKPSPIRLGMGLFSMLVLAPIMMP